ncbi:hypothetical protein [Okeania sp. KiyG1]|uniref:hypothetical protein n=1 Tax=Okeania sp. KiyG1 TaxID=2720165 RepID=UPI001923959D|nr:hypothetical protein [Okeania sp. KiyG1]GGA24122.1 hypothetical protein CYANOKiyG1_39620 [Okeania sp. KiyG1]
MAYNFRQAENAMIIKEMEYGTGERIQFSPFSSCLGVVGRTGTNVTGIHLVEYDREGVRFNEEMATAVKTKLNGCAEWIFMGFVDDWLRIFPNEMKIIESIPNQKKLSKRS